MLIGSKHGVVLLFGWPSSSFLQVRSALETRIGMDMKNYKEYIDNEMMVTMAQMDKPSKIFDYLFLVSPI